MEATLVLETMGDHISIEIEREGVTTFVLLDMDDIVALRDFLNVEIENKKNKK